MDLKSTLNECLMTNISLSIYPYNKLNTHPFIYSYYNLIHTSEANKMSINTQYMSPSEIPNRWSD